MEDEPVEEPVDAAAPGSDAQLSAADEPRPTPVPDRRHLTHTFTGRLHQVLDEVGGASLATLGASELAEVITELGSAMNRLAAVQLEALAHAAVVDVAGEHGATSAAAWLASTTRAPRGEAFGLVKLAQALDRGAGGGFAVTREALTAGKVRLDQAKVIVDAVQRLPVWVSAELRTKGEEHLLSEAAHFDAPALRRLGKHLLEVLDPEGAEEELGRQVAAEERAAARRTMLTLYDDGEGTCHGEFRISSLHGAMLRAAIEALASPKRPDAIARDVLDDDGEPAVRPTVEVHGLALQELLERYPARRLPQAGGGLATVVVTMDVDWLRREVGAATLESGGHVSAGALRRLACQVGVIPRVLGSASQVLDQGRRVRLFTAAQHLALRGRDKTCTATGCAIPAAWCHAHHRTPWGRGGATDLGNGRMLCPRHHTMVHHPRYSATDLPDGRVRITRRRH